MKLVPIFCKYDYGNKKRGDSGESKIFMPALRKTDFEIKPFWMEENGFPHDKKGLQEKILDFVRDEKPDIVFLILMKDEITLDTLEKLGKMCVTVNWFCDDHWRFNSFTRFIAPRVTYSVTVDRHSISRYKKIGCNNVILSQWAAFNYIGGIDFSKINYQYDLTFIGGKNATRDWFIKKLRKKGFKVECFGAGWENGRVTFDQMNDIFLHSKINLFSSMVSIKKSFAFSCRFVYCLYKRFRIWSYINPCWCCYRVCKINPLLSK